MSTLRPTALLLTAIAAACASGGSRSHSAAVLSDAERADGWRLLFDGQSSHGWRGYRRDSFPEGWAIEEGCLVRRGPGGDLVTADLLANFILELEWKIAPGGNSGIFFHGTEEHDYVWETAPEMQILDNANHRDGGDPRTSAGSNYALHAPARDVTRPVGEFNRARIEVRGDSVRHFLNGEEIVSYRLWSPEWEALVAASKFGSMPDYGRRQRGHIALQDHGDEVWFRNIKILDLDRAR